MVTTHVIPPALASPIALTSDLNGVFADGSPARPAARHAVDEGGIRAHAGDGVLRQTAAEQRTHHEPTSFTVINCDYSVRGLGLAVHRVDRLGVGVHVRGLVLVDAVLVRRHVLATHRAEHRPGGVVFGGRLPHNKALLLVAHLRLQRGLVLLPVLLQHVGRRSGLLGHCRRQPGSRALAVGWRGRRRASFDSGSARSVVTGVLAGAEERGHQPLRAVTSGTTGTRRRINDNIVVGSGGVHGCDVLPKPLQLRRHHVAEPRVVGVLAAVVDHGTKLPPLRRRCASIEDTAEPQRDGETQRQLHEECLVREGRVTVAAMRVPVDVVVLDEADIADRVVSAHGCKKHRHNLASCLARDDISGDVRLCRPLPVVAGLVLPGEVGLQIQRFDSTRQHILAVQHVTLEHCFDTSSFLTPAAWDCRCTSAALSAAASAVSSLS